MTQIKEKAVDLIRQMPEDHMFYVIPESVKLSCFLQELLRIDVIHCFASNSSTQFLFVA